MGGDRRERRLDHDAIFGGDRVAATTGGTAPTCDQDRDRGAGPAAKDTELVTADPDDVALYTGALDKLWQIAAEGDDARAILTRLIG